MIGNPICFSTNSIFSAILRKILIVLYSTDVTFPSWQRLDHRFCFLKLHSCREILLSPLRRSHTCANRDLIQISKNIKNCESNVCSSLKTASVFGSNTVEPSHTSRSSSCSTKFTAVTATSSQFICFIAEDFRNECTCSNCTGVCLCIRLRPSGSHMEAGQHR